VAFSNCSAIAAMKGVFHFAVLWAVSAVFSVNADTIVVPNTNANTPGPGAGSTVPFSPGMRWQQFYGSEEFSSVPGDIVEITEIRFRIDEMTSFSNFSTVAKGLNVFMATTTRMFATASPIFAENPETELFEALPLTNLPMSGSRTSATSFDVVVPLPNHFQYDRQKGNLLVDFRSVGGASMPFLDLQGFLPEATFGIAGGVDSFAGTKGSIGFVTQFVFNVVPEPSSAWLALVGAFGLLLSRRAMILQRSGKV
jgi:hypothetical protein